MESPIITYHLEKENIKFDKKEVLRYLGYRKQTVGEMEEAIVEEGISMVQKVISPKACYAKFPLSVDGDGHIKLPYGEIVSKDLTKNLSGCQEIYFFSATIGAEFDRLLQRVRLQSMAKAVVLQACGAAAVEDLCDQLNDYIRQLEAVRGNRIHPRYSPGYGDYPLENQKGVFSILQPARYIGVTLMDTLIMAPEKSVTAVIGVEVNPNREDM